MKTTGWEPSLKAIFEARVRAWVAAHPGVSHWGVSGKRVAARFGLAPNELSMICTWSRTCTHPFSGGPCPRCPVSGVQYRGR